MINQFSFSRSRALKWMDSQNSFSFNFSGCISPMTSRAEAEKKLGKFLDKGSLLDEIVEKATASPTGAVIFYSMDKCLLVRPPFPVKESEISGGYRSEFLKTILERDWVIALVMVRLGYFAIGLFRGEKLIDGTAGTGVVHARHHKGGSSSMRFVRHREKQMETFFTRVEIHARELIEPHLKEIDYVIYGGTNDTLQIMRRQCSFFKKLESKEIRRLLTVREPKRSSFNEAVAQAYTSTVFAISE
jgi:peptide subunit release factor 1 (eRF1)